MRRVPFFPLTLLNSKRFEMDETTEKTPTRCSLTDVCSRGWYSPNPSVIVSQVAPRENVLEFVVPWGFWYGDRDFVSKMGTRANLTYGGPV